MRVSEYTYEVIHTKYFQSERTSNGIHPKTNYWNSKRVYSMEGKDKAEVIQKVEKKYPKSEGFDVTFYETV